MSAPPRRPFSAADFGRDGDVAVIKTAMLRPGADFCRNGSSGSLQPKIFPEETGRTHDVVDLVREAFALFGIKSDLKREGAHKEGALKSVLEVLKPRYPLLVEEGNHDTALRAARIGAATIYHAEVRSHWPERASSQE